MSATKSCCGAAGLSLLRAGNGGSQCRRRRRRPRHHRPRLGLPSIRTSTRSTRTSTPIPSSASRRRARPPSWPGDAGAGLRGDRTRRQDRHRRDLQERRRAHGDGAHRARRPADGGEDRPALRQQGQADLERRARPWSRTAAATTSTWRSGSATARTAGRLKDQWSGTLMFVGQPAEEGRRRQGHAGRRPLHALPQARHRLRPACRRRRPTATSSTSPASINSTSDGCRIVFDGRAATARGRTPPSTR